MALTPDLDGLLQAALSDALDVDVRVLMPEIPADHLPMVVVRQVSGGAAPGMGSVTGIVELKALASTRRDASLLARQAFDALRTACRSRFQGADGYLGWFTPVTGAPVEDRNTVPSPGPTLFLFRATVRVTARAHLTPGG
jgi:hypothetical protein